MIHRWIRLAFLATFITMSQVGIAQTPAPILATRGIQGDTTGTSTVAAPVRGISEDGRFVMIETQGVNLAPGIQDTNLTTDVYLLDRSNTSWQLVSRRLGEATTTASGQSFGVDMTPDGRWVVFRSSANNIVPGVIDTNGTADVFLFDRSTATTILVSRSGASPTVSANNASFGRGISDDGRYVLFESDASNIAGSDANALSDLFLFDRLDGSVRLVTNADGAPTTAANGDALIGRLSADGARVLYLSTATNISALVTDANGGSDAWLWSRDTGTAALISRSAASASTTGSGSVSFASLASSGDWVAYATSATNVISGITDNNASTDVYRWARVGGATDLVSSSATDPMTTGNSGTTVSRISADGAWTTLSSSSTNLVSGLTDTNNTADLFVRDHGGSTTLLISRADDIATQTPVLTSTLWDVTSDSRYFLFSTQANNVGGGVDDGNGVGADVFVFDRVAQSTRLVSHKANEPTTTPTDSPASFSTALSDDGRWALFYSTSAQLVSGVTDYNGAFDVFLKDLQGGTLSLLSRAAQVATNTPSGSMELQGLSNDGRWLLFGSFAPNVVGTTDAGPAKDLFLFDRDTQATQLVSRRNGSSTVTDNNAGSAVLARSGNRVAYNSGSTDVLAGITDNNNAFDLYVYDRSTQSVQLASPAAGQSQITANGESSPRALSADGRYVLFQSAATNLVVGATDANSQRDVFLHDTQSGTTMLISRALLAIRCRLRTIDRMVMQ
ncbi:MAG: PD40 domain-containing protein [Ahniella sp.]|nr:PD40 domain-containing protein [Ahniella sp.]